MILPIVEQFVVNWVKLVVYGKRMALSVYVIRTESGTSPV